MSKSNEDFKPEIEEAESQQDFCDCSHCQEAEEEYHQELERERWEEEKARQIEKEKHEKSFLEEKINDCLMRYVELGGIPTNIEMVRHCIWNFVVTAMTQFEESDSI